MYQFSWSLGINQQVTCSADQLIAFTYGDAIFHSSPRVFLLLLCQCKALVDRVLQACKSSAITDYSTATACKSLEHLALYDTHRNNSPNHSNDVNCCVSSLLKILLRYITASINVRFQYTSKVLKGSFVYGEFFYQPYCWIVNMSKRQFRYAQAIV